MPSRREIRAVGTVGARGFQSPPPKILAERLLNPISNKGADYAHDITTYSPPSPGFSDLLTALEIFLSRLGWKLLNTHTKVDKEGSRGRNFWKKKKLVSALEIIQFPSHFSFRSFWIGNFYIPYWLDIRYSYRDQNLSEIPLVLVFILMTNISCELNNYF